MTRTHESPITRWAESRATDDSGFRTTDTAVAVPALGATEVKVVTPREVPTAWWIGHHVMGEPQPGVSAGRGLSVQELLSHLR